MACNIREQPKQRNTKSKENNIYMHVPEKQNINA